MKKHKQGHNRSLTRQIGGVAVNMNVVDGKLSLIEVTHEGGTEAHHFDAHGQLLSVEKPADEKAKDFHADPAHDVGDKGHELAQTIAAKPARATRRRKFKMTPPTLGLDFQENILDRGQPVRRPTQKQLRNAYVVASMS